MCIRDRNDNDPDGDDLIVSEVNGDAANVGQPIAGTNGGLFTINTDGSYSFDANGDFESLDVGESQTTTIAYQISDGEGGFDEAIVTITVQGANDAPIVVNPNDPNDPNVVDPIPAQTGDDNASITPLDTSPFFDDVDGEPLTFSAANLPTGLVIDPVTGEITGTPDNSASQGGDNGDGTYTVTVTATDPDGESVSTDVTYTISNPAPVVDTPIGSQVGVDNQPVTITPNISDPDGDDLTYSVTGLPVGLAIDPVTGEITGTVDNSASQFGPNNDGVYTVTVTADDGEGGTVTDTFELTITNPAPVVDTPIGPQLGVDDQPITIPSAISDPDGDDLTYTISGLPVGLSIDPATGEITGTVDNSASQFGPNNDCLLYTSPSPRDRTRSRMPSSA